MLPVDHPEPFFLIGDLFADVRLIAPVDGRRASQTFGYVQQGQAVKSEIRGAAHRGALTGEDWPPLAPATATRGEPCLSLS